MFYENISELVGNTPLVKLNRVTKGIKALVLAKLEFLNPGGSVKDRMKCSLGERKRSISASLKNDLPTWR